MKISFVVTGDKEWHRRTLLLVKNWGKIATKPAFQRLNAKLMDTLTELFTPRLGGSAKGQMHSHGYTGSYLAGLRSNITDNALQIYETESEGGRHIREGVGPSGQLTEWGTPVVSERVKMWAMSKLGVDQLSAYLIARSISMRGTGWAGGDSPLQKEDPAGEGRFAYPGWVVLVKNKRDIEDLAEQVGGLAVTYLER